MNLIHQFLQMFSHVTVVEHQHYNVYVLSDTNNFFTHQKNKNYICSRLLTLSFNKKTRGILIFDQKNVVV